MARVLATATLVLTSLSLAAAASYSSTSGSAVTTHNGDSAGGFPSNGGFQVLTDAFGTSGPGSSWTLVYDVIIDTSFSGSYFGLLQTSTANSGDGDLFLQGSGTFGIGITSYAGSVSKGTWVRVGFTMSGGYLGRYIDGASQGSYHAGTSSRFSIGSEVLIMTDNDGESGTGRLAAFAMVDRALSSSEMTALGGPDSAGIFDSSASDVVEFRLSGCSPSSAALGEGAPPAC